MAKTIKDGRPDPNAYVQDLSACDAHDPAMVARAEATRGRVRANRAAAKAETAGRVAYGPGTGDQELIRREAIRRSQA